MPESREARELESLRRLKDFMSAAPQEPETETATSTSTEAMLVVIKMEPQDTMDPNPNDEPSRLFVEPKVSDY